MSRKKTKFVGTNLILAAVVFFLPDKFKEWNGYDSFLVVSTSFINMVVQEGKLWIMGIVRRIRIDSLKKKYDKIKQQGHLSDEQITELDSSVNKVIYEDMKTDIEKLSKRSG